MQMLVVLVDMYSSNVIEDVDLTVVIKELSTFNTGEEIFTALSLYITSYPKISDMNLNGTKVLPSLIYLTLIV